MQVGPCASLRTAPRIRASTHIEKERYRWGTIEARRNSMYVLKNALRIAGTALAARIRVRGRRRGPIWRKRLWTMRTKRTKERRGPTSLRHLTKRWLRHSHTTWRILTSSCQHQPWHRLDYRLFLWPVAARAETLSASVSLEVGGCYHIGDETPSPSTHAHAQVASNRNDDRSPESPRRNGKVPSSFYTPMTSPR
jgi:hypothetical protein